MDADYSVELGSEDPVLDFPWADSSGRLAYVDLKRHPELIAKITETEKCPELAEFLRSANSAGSRFQTAKCDVWVTEELVPEEEVFAASHKFASYVDIVFCETAVCLSFPRHEQFVKRITALLKRAPEISSAVEFCVRRCLFAHEPEVRDGFYITVYVNGYGNDELSAKKNWAIGLKLVENAMLQLSVATE